MLVYLSMYIHIAALRLGYDVPNIRYSLKSFSDKLKTISSWRGCILCNCLIGAIGLNVDVRVNFTLQKDCDTIVVWITCPIWMHCYSTHITLYTITAELLWGTDLLFSFISLSLPCESFFLLQVRTSLVKKLFFSEEKEVIKLEPNSIVNIWSLVPSLFSSNTWLPYNLANFLPRAL